MSIREEDLFAPVKSLFEDLGYAVNAEVCHCDVTAVKDDALIIVELKKTLNVKLLAQGLNRQHSGADVFVAVPKPKNYDARKYRDILSVLRKLELGLIFVTANEKFSFAEVVLEPTPFHPTRIYKKKKTAILEEINARFCDTNIGGTTKKRIVTAYLEQSIHIACLLDAYGASSPKQLRERGSDEKRTAQILQSNVYGWFEKIEKGVYALRDEGRACFQIYPEIAQYYQNLIKKTPQE